ncbi:MAG: glycoside hydrolase family 15 protein, partial [Actinobacteria bacterium]|nr:glycoside hydrolase family 15 protein [Actinomycetota bacterium]
DTAVRREYVNDTLVLLTTFETASGEARLYDCFAMTEGGARRPRHQLLRVVEGVRGTVDVTVRIALRFDYGEVGPWLRHHGRHLYSAVGGDCAIVIAGDADIAPVGDHDLEGGFPVQAGARVRLSLTWAPPENIDPSPSPQASPAQIDERLDETVAWWRRWANRAVPAGAIAPDARRSALILKALTFAPTGAVVAAPTTSLPEAVGAGRNWDYRFSWIRDSQFTVRSLGELGCEAEADGFRRFVERSAAGSASSLQIMYGVGGERRLPELTLDHLDGYRDSKPVRIGNSASEQRQLDVYGYLLDLAWRWHERGRSPDDDYWRFLSSLVDATCERWAEPDRGIWETRGEPQHFVHSKVMCWAAVDRGLRLAEACLRQAPRHRWRKIRDEIRRAVEQDGYDEERGVFRRAFGAPGVDAALLLLPAFDFVAYHDDRMVRTTDAVRRDLDDGGFVRRYDADDGLDGREGVFIACTFWLAETLAHQGRHDDAHAVFDRAAATANDVGLFAEEYDPTTGELLGNIPQGLSHLSHLSAAIALGRHTDGSAR